MVAVDRLLIDVGDNLIDCELPVHLPEVFVPRAHELVQDASLLLGTNTNSPASHCLLQADIAMRQQGYCSTSLSISLCTCGRMM